MTAKGSTKQEILDAALELFSVQGYEATSISQLAEAVGIRKASLYSHFENKQAILDALMQATLEQYEQHSIFACIGAAFSTIKEFYYTWQGTWYSIFLFCFNPEMFLTISFATGLERTLASVRG